MSVPHVVARQPPPSDEPEQPALKKMRVSELLGIPADPPRQLTPDANNTFLTVFGDWAAADAIAKAIPADRGVPLTVLTGFLGAGKSTVLNYILKADHGMKIAVLINEFGQVDIDNQLVDTVAEGSEGDPVTLNNGCICCTISNGFIDAVTKVLEQADQSGKPPDYFIVETTGLANPKSILDSILASSLSEELYIDQVLSVVDASAWNDEHYGSETARAQIENADTVLLSKTDLCDDEKTKQVVKSVLKMRPDARILKSQRGYVPIAALFDLGVSLGGNNAKSNGKIKEADKDGHAHGHDHEHKHKTGDSCGKDCTEKHEHKHKEGEGCGKECTEKHEHKHGEEEKKGSHLEQEGFTSMSFVSEMAFSLRRFKGEFMDELPEGVFRSKGLLMFSGYDSRFVFHWSGSRYHVEEDEWPKGAERKNQLVVIGRNLETDKLKAMLEQCIVRPGEESEDEEEGEEEGMEEGMEGYEGDGGEAEETGDRTRGEGKKGVKEAGSGEGNEGQS